jgi:hypothetical protein
MGLKHLGKRRRLSKNDHKMHESYEQRIEELRIELEKLEKLKKINDYFKHVARCKNSYVVEMRHIVGMGLFAQGYSLSEVTRALHRSSHATVLHLKTIENFPHVKNEVANNYQRWMIDRVYPFTYYKVDVDPTTGKRIATLTYKLKPIDNE